MPPAATFWRRTLPCLACIAASSFNTLAFTSTLKSYGRRNIFGPPLGNSSPASRGRPLSASTEEEVVETSTGVNGADHETKAPNGASVDNGKTSNSSLSRGHLPAHTAPDVISAEQNGDGTISALLKEKLFLGIEPTPEIMAIMTIYFVEGALGLSRLAQTFLLKDTLHLGPAEMSALTGIFTLPWTVKPVYGFLSDGFPLFGYRRRSYLIVAGILGCISYTALGNDFWGFLGHFDTGQSLAGAQSSMASAVSAVRETVGQVPDTLSSAEDSVAMALSTATSGTTGSSMGWLTIKVTDLQGTIAALLLSSACIAFSDVVADGIVVQRTRDSDDPKVAGGLQSLCWGSASLGALLSAYFSGSLLEVMGPREVFQITAILPLMVATIALFVSEEPVWAPKESSIDAVSGNDGVSEKGSDESPLDGVKDQLEALWSAMKQPAIWKPALFLFLWQSTPTSEGATLYFMTNDLGFGPEFLGRARLVSAASALVGVWGYQKFLRGIPVKDVLLWTTIASAPLGLLQLLLITHANRAIGIPDGAFVLGDDVILSILGEFAFLPTLVLAARLCPPGIEAVLFATLMSIFNGASTVGTEVGAALTKYLGITESNFDNLALLCIICNVASLYPLLFIGWLDGVGAKSEEEEEQGGTDLVLDVPTGSVDTKGEL